MRKGPSGPFSLWSRISKHVLFLLNDTIDNLPTERLQRVQEASFSLLASTNGCQYRAVFRHYTNHASRPPKITLFTDRALSTNTPKCTQRDTKSLHKKTHILSVTDTHKTPKRPLHTNTKRHPNTPEAAACGDGNTPTIHPTETQNEHPRTPALAPHGYNYTPIYPYSRNSHNNLIARQISKPR